MSKITRDIDVPFEGCERCRYLDPVSTTIYADGRPYVILTKCSNENLCLEVAKIVREEDHGNK